MNLTWHIVKKDLVRMRLHLLLWAVLLGSQVFVSGRLLSIRSVNLTWFTGTGMLLNLLAAVTLIICFIMTAALVLDDPLAGADMFWVTRPISGGRLLRAKLIAAVLMFGLLPVLFWLPWWLYCDFSAGEVGRAAARVLCVQALAVVPAFTLASLVGQTGRFVLFSALVAVAAWVALLNFVTWGGYQILSPDLLQSRLLLAAGLSVAGGAMVVCGQYLARRFVPSVAILTIGAAAAAAIMLWWPWNFVNLRSENGEQMARSDRISAEIQEVRIAALANTPGPEDIGVLIQILFKGVPDDVSVSSGLADVELRWPDGSSLRKSSLKMVSNYWSDKNERSSVFKALGLPPEHLWLHHWDPETEAKHAELIEADRPRLVKLGNRWQEPKVRPGESRLTLTLGVTAEMATRITADPPACSVSARFVVARPAVLFEMPLKGDTWKAGGGARLHLLNLSPNSWRGVNHEPVRAYLTSGVSASAPGRDGLALYTVDRDHGTASFQGRTSSFSVIPVATNIEGLYFSVVEPRLWRTDKWVEAPGWLESSTLAAVAYDEIGGFNRAFHTDRLTITRDGGD
jgi:hypothetical protein